MSRIAKIIGSIVIAAVLYVIPILFTCAFCFEWDGFLKLLLFVIAAVEFAFVCFAVYQRAEVDDL